MFNYTTCPSSIRSSIQLYLEEGLHPGDFLIAVLSNDLFGAFAKADDINRYQMFEIVKWLYNEAPMTCRGSFSAVEHWIGHNGLKGLKL